MCLLYMYIIWCYFPTKRALLESAFFSSVRALWAQLCVPTLSDSQFRSASFCIVDKRNINGGLGLHYICIIRLCVRVRKSRKRSWRVVNLFKMFYVPLTHNYITSTYPAIWQHKFVESAIKNLSENYVHNYHTNLTFLWAFVKFSLADSWIYDMSAIFFKTCITHLTSLSWTTFDTFSNLSKSTHRLCALPIMLKQKNSLQNLQNVN